MIEHNVARPAPNEWTRVEIFDAADAERFQISWGAPGGRALPVRRRQAPLQRLWPA
jgi:hypothetical protein